LRLTTFIKEFDDDDDDDDDDDGPVQPSSGFTQSEIDVEDRLQQP